MQVVKIDAIALKPMDLKVSLELRLTIENRFTYFSRPIAI